MLRALLIPLTAATFLMAAATSVHDFTMPDIDGKPASLSAYKGKVMLVVNVASQCGYTPQYEGLEGLYTKYKSKGLVIVGFPANNFGGQEPGSNEEIKTFCTRTYKVDFPMYSKISVAGGDQAPLYGFLTQTGGPIKWNFTKFLVDRNGKVIQRFESAVEPNSPAMVQAIEKALQ